MARFRPHLTFANVASVLALIVALSGTALAAGIARDSVKSKQIKDGAVKTTDLADDAVTSAKVDDGSLSSKDFASGQAPAGPQGPQGPAGADGTARAYGTVVAGNCAAAPGACTVTDDKGIASAQHNSSGRFCVAVAGVDATQVSAIAAPEFSGSPGDHSDVFVATVRDPASCPNPTDFVVRTQRANADVDDISFTIIVP
jgi:hypothetical protein